MKASIVIALLVVGCARARDSAPAAAAAPPQVGLDAPTEVVAVEPVPDEDDTILRPQDAVVPAAFDHLRQVVDVTMQTEPRLDDEQVARALDAIADALAALPEPDMLSIDTIRTDAAMLRKMQGRSPHDGRTLRRGLNVAIARLRVIQGGIVQADVDDAVHAIRQVSAQRSIMRQTTQVRDAICAVANAMSVEADTGRYGCIEHTANTARNER